MKGLAIMITKVFDKVLRSSTVDLLGLSSIINDYDILVVEGYDMVGKSTLISNLVSIMSTLDFHRVRPVVVFRPDYDNLCYDDVIDKSNRLVIGLSVLDFIRSDKNYNKLTIFDRGLPSGIVYSALYQDNKLNKCMIDSYIDLYLNMKTCILYINHESKSSAMVKYNKSILDNNHEDDYDKFSSFDEYYSTYLKFNKEFISTISRVPYGIDKVIYSW